MNPEHISKSLTRLLKNLGIQSKVKEHQALIYWPEIVGERISQVTEPQRIRSGRIFVKVKSNAWRNELLYYKSDIIKKMNSRLGKQVIEDIIFT